MHTPGTASRSHLSTQAAEEATTRWLPSTSTISPDSRSPSLQRAQRFASGTIANAFEEV